MEGIMSFITPANSAGILQGFLTLLNPLVSVKTNGDLS